MNNFVTPVSADSESQPSVPKHLESLITSMFQSLFPPIAPQTTSLSSIRRVLLLNRESATSSVDSDGRGYLLDLRHYAITTRVTGLSKGVRRLSAAEKLMRAQERKKRGVPNLSKLDDMADYLLDPSAAAGYTSASESDADTDAVVEVLEMPARKVMSTEKRDQQRANGANATHRRGKPVVERRAVKLEELGPRMKLRLVKVEEGLCSGRVMWHDFIDKTKDEVRALDGLWEERRKQKEERRRQQRENVARKRKDHNDGTQKGENGTALDDEVWDSADFEEDEEMDAEEEAVDEATSR